VTVTHYPQKVDVGASSANSPTYRDGRLVIWFVNQYAGSPTYGMELRHHALGRELQAQGHTVIVISGSFSHLFVRQPRTTGRFTVAGVDGLTYCWVRVPRYRSATSAGRLFNMIVFMVRLFSLPTGLLAKPDAIVVSSPSLFPILPADRWARREHARLIFEVRDIWPLTLQELGGLSPRHPAVVVMGWFERHAYRVADAVVSVLPGAAPHLQSQGMAAEKLTIIPNGVTIDREEEQPSTPPVRGCGSASHFTVGFAGTLGAANAIETLIEAARLVADDDIRFVIVGHGAHAGELQRLARDLPSVEFKGPVPHDELHAVLQGFDVCYVGYKRSPLYRFGVSPNKVFEYMAAARPILMASEAFNDPVREADCGLTVPPDDPQALVRAIESMRSMTRQEREQLGANGHAFVLQRHSYRSLAAAYLRVLRPSNG